MRTVDSVLEELEREGSWLVYVSDQLGFSPERLRTVLSESALTATATVEQEGGCIGQIRWELTSAGDRVRGVAQWRLKRVVSCSQGVHTPETLAICDAWRCLCGNEAHLDGFLPIDPVDVRWGNLRCGRCGRVVSRAGLILSSPDALVERWG